MSRQSGGDYESPAEEAEDDDDESSSEGSAGMSGFGRITDGAGVAVDPQRRVTLGTYFNAFPASYWRRWTEFSSVRLTTRLRGHGSVIVYRSTAKGHVVRADSYRIDNDETETVTFELPLKPFIDGGWYWFDLEGGHGELVLEDASWGFETDRVRSGRITIGITTFNRPDFCVAAAGQPGVEPRGARHHRRDRRGRPGHATRSSTTRASSPRPPGSATSCGSSSSPTSAVRAASRGR